MQVGEGIAVLAGKQKLGGEFLGHTSYPLGVQDMSELFWLGCFPDHTLLPDDVGDCAAFEVLEGLGSAETVQEYPIDSRWKRTPALGELARGQVDSEGLAWAADHLFCAAHKVVEDDELPEGSVRSLNLGLGGWRGLGVDLRLLLVGDLN